MFAARLSVSVVIAAGFSLWLGWEKPVWAMFAVIYCALGDEGESLHKGTLRILATFMGGGMSLLITALFNDHRWAFGGAVLVWIMFCSYMMQNNRRYYMWLVAAMLTVLMPIYSAEQPARAFEVVMLRLEETIVGVIVYTLVACVLLPDRKRKSFVHELRDQVVAANETLQHLLKAWRDDPQALLDGEKGLQLRNEALALHTSFRNRIDVGIVESFDVVENRDAWSRAIDELDAIIRLLNRVCLSLADIPAPARAAGQLPDISDVTGEIHRRLDAAAAILDGGNTVELPRPVAIPRPELSGENGDVFAHGAVLVALDALEQIATRSGDLLAAVATGRGLTGRHALPRRPAQTLLPSTIIPNPEHIAGVLRIGVMFWTAFLIYIFVPELPGGSQIILLCTVIGLFVSMVPTIPVLPVYVLGNIVILIAGVIHMVVMPKFSSFWGLGAILLVYNFAVAALLAKATVAPLRFVSLGFAAMILQVTNDQAYSFTYVANMLFVFQAPFIMIWLTQVFPVSLRPERVFQRLLRRYMTSFGALIDAFQHDQRSRPQSWWQRQVRAWHLRNLMQIPDALLVWIKAMPATAMSAADREQAQSLARALFNLGGRMADLMPLSRMEYSPETVARLRRATSLWRQALGQLGANFRDAPDKLPSAERLSATLDAHLDELRADARAALNGGTRNESPEGATSLLRELSLYRGLSEALISAIRHASALNWTQLRETRF